LEYLHNVMILAKGKAEIGDLAYSVAGIEIYHLEKRGNNIRALATDRVAARREILEKYEAIRGRYYNSFFRRQVILNLLRDEPWHRGFDEVFAKNDCGQFVGTNAWSFSADIRRIFN
jgi:CRISPR-associated protein Cmx8